MQIEITSEYLSSQGLSKTFPKRFWEKVEKTEECWLWKARKHKFGYGEIHRIGQGGAPIRAHVASWIIHFGPVPEGLSVLHKCDVPGCVRPDHLFLGTQADNVNDCIKKGRTIIGSKGIKNPMSKLTDDEVLGIFRLFEDPVPKLKQILSKRFGVCKGTIDSIVSGRRWTHITGKLDSRKVLSEREQQKS